MNRENFYSLSAANIQPTTILLGHLYTPDQCFLLCRQLSIFGQLRNLLLLYSFIPAKSVSSPYNMSTPSIKCPASPAPKNHRTALDKIWPFAFSKRFF